MNPYLLASDIAALVGAIASAISTTYQYAASVTSAKQAREDFLCELRALKISLDNLEDVICKASASSPGYSSASVELGSNLSRCKGEIEELQAALQNRLDSKKMRNRIRDLTWPFTAKETQDRIQKLKEYQGVFQSVLAVDTWKLASLTLSKVNELFENQEKAQQSLKRKEVINWLSKISGNHQAKHNEIDNNRIRDTGKWLLQLPELQGFMHGKDEYRFLWCHGLPGAGKTHLSWVVIDTLKKIANGPVLYWYFDYRYPNDQHHTFIRSSLLMQLVEGIPTLPTSIEELYEQNKETKGRLNKSILMREISALLTELEQSFVVLDAFDECIESSRKEILEMISHFQKMGARIFITSRQNDPERRSSGWVPIEIKAHAEDLRHLIDHKLQNKCSRNINRIMTDEFKEEVVETIVSKTDGMFLWASLQLDEVLKGATTTTTIRSELQNMPKGIFNFFGEVMRRVADDDFALRTLLWLVYAKEPLNFDALSHGLSISLEKGMLDDIDRDNIPCIEDLAEACCGLTVIDGKNNLRLAHFSILEYLKNNPQKFGPYNDLYIAKVCLRYLSLRVFESRGQYDDEKIGQRVRDYPLLEYAARRWRWHVPRDGQFIEIDKEMLHLYSNEGLFGNYIDVYHPWWLRHAIQFGLMKPFFNVVHRSPLYNAVELQLPGVIHHLLSDMEYGSLGTIAGATPLILAVRDNRKDLVDMLLKAGVDPSLQVYVPWATKWNIFRDATYVASELQEAMDSFQKKEKLFCGEWYPSTLAIIMGHRDIFEMLRAEVKVKGNLDIIGDILTRAVEEENGQDIVAEILRDYPAIDHRHPAYVRALEGKRWAIHPDRGRMLQILLDARPQLDDKEGLLTKLLPSVILYVPEYVKTFLNRGASPNIRNEESCMSLSAAIYQKDEQLAISLVDKGAEVSANVFSEAAWNNMNDLIRYMLDKGYNVSAQSADVSVASAVDKGHVDTLLLLLSRGANIDSIGMFEDRTALQIAASQGNDDIARILLENGANPNAESAIDGTPLAIASYWDYEVVVRLLIDHGAEVNRVDISKHGTALCAAASKCSLRACGLLLAKGADPNLGRESLPLLAALQVNTDNVLVIEMLLENGADPMRKNCKQEYPLERAVYQGQEDIVRLFLKHGATLDAYGSRGSILHAAAASWKKDMVQIMLELGAKVTETNNKFGGILQWARPEDYQLLIEHGAKVNVLGRRHGTAIQAAISRATDSSGEDKLPEAIHYLVEAGDDVNAMGGFYGSAIQAASFRGYLQIVKLLLHYGASPNAKGGRCGTALQAAAYCGHVSVVNMLISNGADVNQRSGSYDTALQAAAFQGHIRVVELLLKHGADVNAQGGKYNNALDAAKQKHHYHQNPMRKILLSHGAVDHGPQYIYKWLDDTGDYDKSSDTFNYDDDEEEGNEKQRNGVSSR